MVSVTVSVSVLMNRVLMNPSPWRKCDEGEGVMCGLVMSYAIHRTIYVHLDEYPHHCSLGGGGRASMISTVPATPPVYSTVVG